MLAIPMTGSESVREVTVRAMESFLRRVERLSGVSFADPESFPWDQTLIESGSPSARSLPRAYLIVDRILMQPN